MLIINKSLKIKEDYVDIPRTVVIWIWGFILFEDLMIEINDIKKDVRKIKTN